MLFEGSRVCRTPAASGGCCWHEAEALAAQFPALAQVSGWIAETIFYDSSQSEGWRGHIDFKRYVGGECVENLAFRRGRLWLCRKMASRQLSTATAEDRIPQVRVLRGGTAGMQRLVRADVPDDDLACVERISA